MNYFLAYLLVIICGLCQNIVVYTRQASDHSMKMLTNGRYTDLAVVGYIKADDGLGKSAIGLIDCLKNDISINFIKTRRCFNKDVSMGVQSIVDKSYNSLPARVSILEDALDFPGLSPYAKMPKSYIKIAYSMFESTLIPSSWPFILNEYFDAVVVPDEYHVQVYKNSGVKIPIFVIPLGVRLEEFLKQPVQPKKNKPFIFGCSGFFSDRKNYKRLVEAFAQEFGNSKDVKLIIHGKADTHGYLSMLQHYIKSKGLTNVFLRTGALSSQDYINFLSILNSYIFISKGEGFSLTPREAMGMGIPCILSNNSAQKTLCQSNLVLAVPSNEKEPAYYELYKKVIGHNFNCKITDIRHALRTMYYNYDTYLSKALKSRDWVKQYLYSQLKYKYLALVKPQSVILGSENKILDNKIITTSPMLYEKYMNIINRT